MGMRFNLFALYDNGNLLHPDDFFRKSGRVELLYGNDYTLSVAKKDNYVET